MNNNKVAIIQFILACNKNPTDESLDYLNKRLNNGNLKIPKTPKKIAMFQLSVAGNLKPDNHWLW